MPQSYVASSANTRTEHAHRCLIVVQKDHANLPNECQAAAQKLAQTQ